MPTIYIKHTIIILLILISFTIANTVTASGLAVSSWFTDMPSVVGYKKTPETDSSTKNNSSTTNNSASTSNDGRRNIQNVSLDKNNTQSINENSSSTPISTTTSTSTIATQATTTQDAKTFTNNASAAIDQNNNTAFVNDLSLSTQALNDMNNIFASGNSSQIKDLVSAAQGKAAIAVDSRIKALNILSQKIAGAQQMSDNTKTALQQEIAKQISDIQDLKNKTMSEVSIASLKNDANTITATFNNYVMTIPKMSILITADRITSLSSDMQIVGTKLKTLIKTAALKRKNVGNTQNILSDYMAQTSEAQFLASTIQNDLNNLQPNSDKKDDEILNTNISIITDAQIKIKKAQQDLINARTDITTIRQNLSK